MKTMKIAAGAASAAALTLALAPAAFAEDIPDEPDIHTNQSPLTASQSDGDVEVTVTANGEQVCVGPFLVEGEVDPDDLDEMPDDVDDSAVAAVVGDEADGDDFSDVEESPYTATFEELDADESYTAVSICFSAGEEGEAEGDVYVRSINYNFGPLDAVFDGLSSLDLLGSLDGLQDSLTGSL